MIATVSNQRPKRVSPPKQSDALPRTLADVLHDFGDIDASRVRLRHFGCATVADVLDIDAHEDRLCELVDGVLVEKPMGFPDDYLALCIAMLLKDFVDSKNLGLVVGSQGMMQLIPGL